MLLTSCLSLCHVTRRVTSCQVRGQSQTAADLCSSSFSLFVSVGGNDDPSPLVSSRATRVTPSILVRTMTERIPRGAWKTADSTSRPVISRARLCSRYCLVHMHTDSQPPFATSSREEQHHRRSLCTKRVTRSLMEVRAKFNDLKIKQV